MTTYKIDKAIESNKKYAVFAQEPETGDWHTQATFDSKEDAQAFIDAKISMNTFLKEQEVERN